jgi:hypothetical protein
LEGRKNQIKYGSVNPGKNRPAKASASVGQPPDPRGVHEGVEGGGVENKLQTAAARGQGRKKD